MLPESGSFFVHFKMDLTSFTFIQQQFKTSKIDYIKQDTELIYNCVLLVNKACFVHCVGLIDSERLFYKDAKQFLSIAYPVDHVFKLCICSQSFSVLTHEKKNT